jgi:hypothetical protein
MSSPKERLLNAAHRLAGAAERVEDIALETLNGTVSNGQGEIGRTLIVEGIAEVRAITKEIEEIVK